MNKESILLHLDINEDYESNLEDIKCLLNEYVIKDITLIIIYYGYGSNLCFKSEGNGAYIATKYKFVSLTMKYTKVCFNLSDVQDNHFEVMFNRIFMDLYFHGGRSGDGYAHITDRLGGNKCCAYTRKYGINHCFGKCMDQFRGNFIDLNNYREKMGVIKDLLCKKKSRYVDSIVWVEVSNDDFKCFKESPILSHNQHIVLESRNNGLLGFYYVYDKRLIDSVCKELLYIENMVDILLAKAES